MSDYFQLLLVNWLSVIMFLMFFLPYSLLMGGLAAVYGLLFSKIKNKLLSYTIPFAIILLWCLWVAAQEMPGPMITIVNYGYMLVIYPMAAASLLPLANHFARLKNGWPLAIVVGTAVMLVMLTAGGMKGEQVAPIPVVPPTYVDNLVKWFVSLLSTMGYLIAGYFIAVAMVKIHERIKNKRWPFTGR